MSLTVDKRMLQNKIKLMLCDNIGVDPDVITGSSLLQEELDIDSFDALRLIFEVEEEFDIKVPPAELPGIKTVDDVVDYLFSRISSSLVR